MELETSKTYATDRGYTDWTGESDAELTRYLLLAQDYIDARYTFKSDLTDAEQSKLDVAQFKIAYDILLNGEQPIRAERIALKESKELAGMKVSREYEDTHVDPYPAVTRLLAPILIGGGSVRFGKLVR